MMELAIGGLAGVGAGFITNPLDVVKTRMQLQGELRAKGQYEVHYRGTIHAAYTIACKDGILSLQKGLVPALGFQLLMNGTRLGIYKIAEDNNWTKDTAGNLSLFRCSVWSAASGVFGAVLGSPMYLVKTQIQSYSHESIAVGMQHKYNGTWEAFTHIYKTYGLKGLFKGVSSSLPRAAVGSATQLTTFSSFKNLLKDYNIYNEIPLLQAFIASCLSGVFIAIAICPFDVASTRLYNEASDSTGRGKTYNGVTDCLVKIYKTEGLFGYYKGVTPLLYRFAPQTILSLVIWEDLTLRYNNFKQSYSNL